MKILLAVDGSVYTKKMLAYLTTHDELFTQGNEYTVFTVQPELPPRAKAAVGKEIVANYHSTEAEKVLAPVSKFLLRHGIDAKSSWKTGPAGETIAKLAASGKFDLLVMDAFSSDSVPVHLLTRQAFQLYAKHLRDDESILAINVSNRFLDFSSLVANQALDLGFQPWVVVVVKPAPGRSQSMWMLLSRSPGFGADPEVGRLARLIPPRDPVRWTDDFSPLYPLLR